MKTNHLSLLILVLALLTVGIVAADTGRIGHVKGDFAGFNPADNSMILSTKNGFVTLDVNAGTTFMRKRTHLTVDQVIPGERLSVYFDRATRTALKASVSFAKMYGFITVLSPVDDRSPQGSYQVAITPDKGGPRLLTTTPDIIVLRNGRQSSVASLLVGDQVSADFDNKDSSVFRIVAQGSDIEPDAETGILTLVAGPRDDGTYVVEITSDEDVDLLVVTDATEIFLDGNPASILDLHEGYTATITFDAVQDRAQKIEAFSN